MEGAVHLATLIDSKQSYHLVYKPTFILCLDIIQDKDDPLLCVTHSSKLHLNAHAICDTVNSSCTTLTSIDMYLNKLDMLCPVTTIIVCDATNLLLSHRLHRWPQAVV